MKKVGLIYFSLLTCFSYLKAQTLNVDDAISPADLITNLVTSNCNTTSNIAMNSDGSGQSINSYGSFTAASNPNFDLTEGMVLTTGTAVNAGTAGALNINGDTANWSGSTFYEDALGLPSGTTFNATEVEFSFLALKNNILIDYVFASEEYVLSTLCTRNEGVVILIKEASDPDTMYTNIALVPGTSDPVTVSNIHAERAGVCTAVNEGYLGGARGFTTPFPNYSQYTTTLQAQTNSAVGTEYTVKIIIADEEDGNYDSAVFVGPIDNEQETPISAIFNSDSSPVTINNNTIDECTSGVTLQLDLTYPGSYTYEWLNGATVIAGENTTSLSVTNTGSYTARVYQSASCFSEETIDVTLNVNQTGNDLMDFNECVSSGTTATFVLSDQDLIALAGRSATDVVYFSGSTMIPSAQEGNYTGTNGEVISAVITEASGCVYTSTFVLNVEVNGGFFDPLGYDLVLCDESDPLLNDGYTAVYPSDIEALLPVLTSGSYTYYDHNNNIITDSGVGTFTTNPPGDPHFRIEYNGDSGCTSSAELRITVNQPPSVTPGTITFVEVCDDGSDGGAQDGFATFDMTPKRDEIQVELDAVSSTATIGFYPSLQLAETGNTIDEISDIANYVNDAAETLDYIQLVGIRIESSNGCYTVLQLELRPRYLITNADFQEVRICDIGADGFEAFDLSGKKAEIAGTNNYMVSIYRSFSDAQTNVNEITDPELASFTNETIDTQRLWVRLEDLDTGCVDYDEDLAVFDLFVDTKPSVNTPVTSELTPICDPGTDGQVNGLVDYFTNEIAAEITTDSSLSISYFDYQPDPNTVDPNTAIDNTYLNVVSNTPLTYWAMAFNPSFGCFSDPVSFQLQVNPAPLVDNATPNTVYFCYDTTDTDPQIPIEENNLVVINDQTDITISYYTTQDGAINENTAELIDLSAGFFSNVNTSIWYRIENDITGCFSLVEQPIVVNTIPTVQALDDFILCVDPGNTQAGFLLSSQDAFILNGQTDKIVRYFPTESLADLGSIADEIDKNTPFDATDGTEIFVRIENSSDPNCFNENNIQSFVLNVAEYSTTGNATAQLTDCGLFGVAEFDLQRIINDITINGTVTDLRSIDFYEDPNDAGFVAVLPNNVPPPAANPANAISDTDNDPNTLLFTNNTPLSQQIFVRIENNSGCVTFQTFDLLVNETPIAGSVPSIISCDTNGDNTEDVDLTEIEDLSALDFSQMVRPILDINDITFNYFTSEAGRDAFEINSSSTTDLITTPANFTVNQTGDTTIYLAITANTSCVFATEFVVQLNALPEIIPVTVEVCEDALGSNQFSIDLDTLNDDFQFYAGGDADVRLDYYSDAAGTIPLSGQYTKTTSTTAIYLQAVNTRTNCISNNIIQIPLVANALPTIIAPSVTEAVTCDNDGINDGVTIFDLSSLNSIVLNGQDPNIYTVTYLDGASAEILPGSQVTNAQTCTAVITNTITECENTIDFVFTVNQLPEIETLNLVPFCDDDEITTNTSIIDLTEVVAAFNYTTSVQASVGGIRYYSDEQRLNEITTPTLYNKVGDLEETIYLELSSDDVCSYQTDFIIQMNPMPVINVVNPLVFCEDAFGTGQYTFVDFTTDIAADVLDDPSLYDITYHTDITATPANEIMAPYTTTDTTIYIRVVSASGCDNVAPVPVEVSPIPSINPITSPTDVCDTDGINDGIVIYDFNVYKAELLGAQNEADFIVTYHDTEQNAEDDISFNLEEITTGTYYVKILNRNSDCYSIGPINMTINTLPEIDDEEIFFCENFPSRIFDKNTGNPEDSYLWVFSNGRASVSTSSISLSEAEVGSTATLTVTNTITGCPNSHTFTINNSPTAQIEPLTIKNFDTDEVVIEVSEPGEYLYALTKTNVIPNVSEAQESNEFTDLLPGKYYAHVIDLNGCGDIEPVEVNFVDYYPYFTPDGQGPLETETWHIQSIEEIPDTVAYIYNRHGVLMYTLYNGSSGWDGTYNGKPMPSDDYWILIELPDGEGTIKDHITLKR